MYSVFNALFFFLLTGNTLAGPSSGVWGDENINKRLDQREAMFSKLTENPDNMKFRNLAGYAGLNFLELQRPLTDEQNTRVDLLKQAYREKVMTQPGHAKAVADDLRSFRKSLNHQRTFFWKMKMQAPDQLKTLEYIKSHESALEIASFLKDRRGERGFPKQSHQKEGSTPSYGFWAATTLFEMKFENPPDIATNGHALAYLKEPGTFTGPWAEWWQEIEDGKRTFQFKGDPQVYNINGPVPADRANRAPHNTGQRLNISGKNSPVAQGSEEANIPLKNLVLPIALILILGIGLRWFHTSKKASR
jgi:hypothetical protein